MTVLIKQIIVGAMDNFAYIVSCSHTGQALLVDPSAQPDRLLKILARDALELVGLVNTHGHADHVAGNQAILQHKSVPVYAHRQADFSATDPVSRQIFRALDGQPPAPPSQRLDDGDSLALGKHKIQVLHAPGHTPGDILLYWPGDDEQAGFVITGDVLFIDAIGRTDLPGSDAAQMHDSLQKIAALPDATRVFPGHNYGPRPTDSLGGQKRSNPYLRQAAAELQQPGEQSKPT